VHDSRLREEFRRFGRLQRWQEGVFRERHLHRVLLDGALFDVVVVYVQHHLTGRLVQVVLSLAKPFFESVVAESLRHCRFPGRTLVRLDRRQHFEQVVVDA